MVSSVFIEANRKQEPMPVMESKIGVLLTSHPGHRIFLKETMDRCWSEVAKKYPLVMGWDAEEFEWHHSLPDHIELFCLGSEKGPKGFGLHLGEWKQIEIGVDLLSRKGCTYILKCSADHILKKWEAIDLIPDWLGSGEKAPTVVSFPIAGVGMGAKIFYARLEGLRKILIATQILQAVQQEHHPLIKFGTIENVMGRACQVTGESNKRLPVKEWESWLGWFDLQYNWQLRVSHIRKIRAWVEGAKAYDVTEEEVMSQPVGDWLDGRKGLVAKNHNTYKARGSGLYSEEGVGI
jgi:hypothetical protein